METEQVKKRAGLIETLHAAQDSSPQNYLSDDKLKEIGEEYGVSFVDLSGLASFYRLFSTKPRGRYVIRVCESLPCRICGSIDVYLRLTDRLGIRAGETTRDGLFTLEAINCIGNCDKSPTMMINNELYSNITPEAVDELIDALQKEA